MRAMKLRIVLGSLLVVGAASAATISEISVVDAGASGCVRVRYNLDADAVVTFDALTNGVPVAATSCMSVTGAVFRLVKAGAASFDWAAGTDLSARLIKETTCKIRLKAWATDAPPTWMVVNLAGGKSAVDVNYYETKAQIPGGITAPVYKRQKLLLRRVPAANVVWRQGTASGGRYVKLTEDYYLATYLLTEAQYAYLTSGTISSSFRVRSGLSYSSVRGAGWPENGHEITDSSKALYKFRDYTGLPFDLPTEAQWEFACRAAEGASLYTGEELSTGAEDKSTNLDRIAWYYYNWGVTHALPNSNGYAQVFPDVGQLEPNAWDFYDMLGSAFEWCLDWSASYSGGTSVAAPEENPPGSTSGNNRVLRGGAMDQGASTCRVHARASNPPGNGLYSWGLMKVNNGGGSGTQPCVANFGVRLCLPCRAVR